MEPLIKLGGVIVLMIVGYIFGSDRERRHFADIQMREMKLRHFPVRVDQVNYDEVREVFLVTGSVVVATDFFKKPWRVCGVFSAVE